MFQAPEPAAIPALKMIFAPDPVVLRSLPFETSILLEALAEMLPDEVIFSLIEIFPPKRAIGPAKVVVLAIVMLAVLVDLPMVKPDNVLPKFQPDVLKELLKLVPADSMRKEPFPAKVLLVGLGASFCKTKVPPEIVVVPPYELLKVSVKVPVPCLVKLPAPEITPLIELDAPLESIVRLLKEETLELIVTLPEPDEIVNPVTFVVDAAPIE